MGTEWVAGTVEVGVSEASFFQLIEEICNWSTGNLGIGTGCWVFEVFGSTTPVHCEEVDVLKVRKLRFMMKNLVSLEVVSSVLYEWLVIIIINPAMCKHDNRFTGLKPVGLSRLKLLDKIRYFKSVSPIPEHSASWCLYQCRVCSSVWMSGWPLKHFQAFWPVYNPELRMGDHLWNNQEEST